MYRHIQANWIFYFCLFLTVIISFFITVTGGHDDTHITFWPAYTLAKSAEILNYNGARIEQSSSLLLTLILAAAYKITGFSISSTAYFLSWLSGLAVIAISYFLSVRFFDKKAAALTVLVFPFMIGWQYWMLSGMEMVLYALLLLVLVFALSKQPPPKILLPFLLLSIVLIRPESPLVLLTFFGITLIESKLRNFQQDKYLVLLLVLFFLAVLGFRYFYFAKLFPLPVYSKVSLGESGLVVGLGYLITPVLNWSFIVIGIFITWAIFRGFRVCPEEGDRSKFVYYAHRLIIAQLLFIIFSGGDWMRFSRFLIPIIPLIIIICINALYEIKNKKIKISFSILILLSFISTAILDVKNNLPSFSWKTSRILMEVVPSEYNHFEYANREHFSDIVVLPKLKGVVQELYNYKKEPVIILSGQMGMTMFYLAKEQFSKFYVYDRYSLVADDFFKCKDFNSWSNLGLGRNLDYGYLASYPGDFWQECNLVKPDVIYDIWSGSSKVLDQLGYELIYLQDGQVYLAAGNKERVVLKAQIIAVEKSLLLKIPSIKKERVIFNDDFIDAANL